MKGIIFNVTEKAVTELLGEDAWDDLLDDAGLMGDYTALGTYPDEELLALISAAAVKTGHDPADVQRLVGRQVLPHLVASIEDFLDPDLDVFEFLASIHSIIHVEVKKLDPNAQPPDVIPKRISDDELQLTYRSERGLSPLAEGLVLGAGDYYNDPVTIEVLEATGGGREAVLVVRRAGAAVDDAA